MSLARLQVQGQHKKKLVVFLYTSNEHLEIKCLNIIYNISNNLKCSGINLTKVFILSVYCKLQDIGERKQSRPQ